MVVVTVAARVSVSPGATFVEAVEDVPIDTIGDPTGVGVAVSGMPGGVAVLAGMADGVLVGGLLVAVADGVLVGVAVSGMPGGVAVLAGVADGGIMTTVVSEYGGMLCAKALPMPETDPVEMVLLCMPYE